MSTLQLQLGDDPFAILGALGRPVHEAARELIVLELYREGRIAAGRAAEFLGMSQPDFFR